MGAFNRQYILQTYDKLTSTYDLTRLTNAHAYNRRNTQKPITWQDFTALNSDIWGFTGAVIQCRP
jgi:hypothetical protein